MEHVYQESKFGPPWFGFDDIYKEAVAKAEDGANFVEVGSFMGKSAAFMCVEIINSGKDIRFNCVDTWEGSVEHQEIEVIKEKRLYDVFMENMQPFLHIVNPIKMASVDAAKFFEDESLDLVFIDASHEEQDVKNDIDAWFPKVKKGGVLAGDDWGFDGVNAAVHSRFNNSKIESGNVPTMWETGFDVRRRSWVVQK